MAFRSITYKNFKSLQNVLLPDGRQSINLQTNILSIRSNSTSAQLKGGNRSVSTPRSVPALNVTGFSNSFSKEKRFSQGKNYAPSSLNTENMHVNKPRRAEPLLGPSRARAERTDNLFKAGLRPGHVSLHDDSYKNPVLLSSYVTEMGKIMPRRLTNLTRRSQREVAKAIRRARSMGLMPVMSKNSFRAWTR